jgi:hypothetical protein
MSLKVGSSAVFVRVTMSLRVNPVGFARRASLPVYPNNGHRETGTLVRFVPTGEMGGACPKCLHRQIHWSCRVEFLAQNF